MQTTISPNNPFRSQILTPRGTPVRFKHKYDRGNQQYFARKGISPMQYSGVAKSEAPVLGLWSAMDGYFVLALDIDHMDEPGHITSQQARDMFAHLEVPHLLSHSISGKPKAFILVKAAWMTTKRAKECLQSLLPAELAAVIDYSFGGMSLCFFNESIFQQLAHWLPTAQVATQLSDIPADLLSPSEQAELGIAPCSAEEPNNVVQFPSKKARPAFKYHLYTEALPMWAQSFVEDGRGGTRELREGFIRILMAAWNLTEKFDLPTTKLSEQLGCTPSQVSNMITDLRSMNLLSCVDSSYIIGKKAKTYKAVGILADFIATHKAAVKSTYVRPTVCKDGGFYQQCLSLLRSFGDDAEGFEEHVSSMVGITPNRMAEARRYLTCELRKKKAA